MAFCSTTQKPYSRRLVHTDTDLDSSVQHVQAPTQPDSHTQEVTSMGWFPLVSRDLGTTMPRARLLALNSTFGFRFGDLDMVARQYELIVPITTTLSHATCFLGLVEEVCRIPAVAKLRSVARLLPYIKKTSRVLTFAEAAGMMVSVVAGKNLLNPSSVNIAGQVANDATPTDKRLAGSIAGNVSTYDPATLLLTVAPEIILSLPRIKSTAQDRTQLRPMGYCSTYDTRLHTMGETFLETFRSASAKPGFPIKACSGSSGSPERH
ncbi:hypothetical protein LTR54_009102 [Friedmanniomyces endolithicus]|nr:hypothetical protein LTS00_001126 [Friedmanniomyces endolithicus]KAK0999358.1 hypothetical protein LTR54_009102 [Friedmanniomyces endolithicus]